MAVVFVVGFDDVFAIITPHTHITYSRATKTTHTKIIQLSHLFTYVPTYIPTAGYGVWGFLFVEGVHRSRRCVKCHDHAWAMLSKLK